MNNEVLNQANKIRRVSRSSKKMTSSENSSLEQLLINQIKFSGPYQLPDELSTVCLKSIPAEDGLAKLLATQMVLTHQLFTVVLTRASVEVKHDISGKVPYINAVAKLSNAFTRQLEILMAYQNHGRPTQEKIANTVNVAAGAQAIVGHVHPTKIGKP